MDTSTSAGISRYPPSVIATWTVAAVAAIYFLHTTIRQTQISSSSSLHRSNAIRRPNGASRRSERQDLDQISQLIQGADPALAGGANDSNAINPPSGPEATERQENVVAADSAETENSIDDSTEEQSPLQRGTQLQELVYAIAKNASELEGIVHRGISCDKCHKLPIVGIRYHCVNCADFDLCEDCEATDCHLKTHVFYKVKIPSPWAGKSPLPVWYPGDPTSMPNTLENGPFKNTLAIKTGFSHNKIDGLYQQFSCMANVKVTKHPGMGIDRAAFDHCFIGQTMTERPSTPNLVHDRLFAFYDYNGDEIVDFEEFVVGTSLVHSKDKIKREKRIFRGLDLDNDKYISRKDCLKMFRAFYSLNKDMMLGYIRAEREGDNGDLARYRQDPRGHLAHGRPLASFFEDSPSFLPRSIDQPKPSSSMIEELDPHLLVPLTLSDLQTDWFDLLPQEQIQEKTWLSLWTVFNDEIFRLCAGKQMKWLENGLHVQIIPPSLRIDQHGEVVQDEAGQSWAADATHYGQTAYLRLESSDLTAATNDDELLFGTKFYERVHSRARSRLCFETIYPRIRERAKRRSQDARLSDGPPLYGRTAGAHMLDRPMRDMGPGEPPMVEIPAPPQGGNIKNNTRKNFVGGTAAAHTIYKVIEEALNDLMDPLFKPTERLALEIQATESQRYHLRNKLSKCITDRSKQYRKTLEIVESTKEFFPHLDPPKTQEGREQAVRDFSQRVRHSVDTSDPRTLRIAYDAWSSIYMDNKYEKLGAAEEHFYTWCVELEASLLLEEHHSDEGIIGYEWPWIRDPASLFRDNNLEGLELNLDVTLPQNRPSEEEEEPDVSRSNKNGVKMQDKPYLAHLICLEAVARNNEIKGNSGLLDFAEFIRKLEFTEENGDKLLGWIGNWVDLIMF